MTKNSTRPQAIYVETLRGVCQASRRTDCHARQADRGMATGAERQHVPDRQRPPAKAQGRMIRRAYPRWKDCGVICHVTQGSLQPIRTMFWAKYALHSSHGHSSSQCTACSRLPPICRAIDGNTQVSKSQNYQSTRFTLCDMGMGRENNRMGL